MNQQILEISPNIAVLHLDGNVVAGHISSSKLMKFLPIDLVLLDQFSNGADVMDVVRGLQQGPARQLLVADPLPQGLLNRIQTLQQAHILKPTPSGM